MKLIKSFKRISFIYICGLVVATLVSFYTISLKIKPTANETFGLLIEGNEINLDEEDLVLSKNIKKREIYNLVSSSLPIFTASISDTIEYDVLIVKGETFNNNVIEDILVPLFTEDLDRLIPAHSTNYIKKENTIYGFEITENLISSYNLTLTTDYYACLISNSVHSGEFNNKSSQESITFLNSIVK